MSFAEIIVLGPGEGKTVSVGGDRCTFKAVGKDTGGAYALVEITAPAVSPGPPPHIHEGEDEAFYVLEGSPNLQVAERTMQLAAGAFAFVPRGTIHTYSNPGSKPAKLLVIVSPAGFEKALEEMAEAAPGDQPLDMEKLLTIAKKYGLKII
jgi:quercetin dioxygenase-like cupin family protein